MKRTDRGINTTGSGKSGRFCIAGMFSLLFLLATGTHALALECIDCHNPSGIPTPHDASCNTTSCLQTCHPKNLNLLQHPVVPAGPVTDDRTATCRTCHDKPWEGVYHPYKINVSAGSLTPPGAVDLDQACGQCHGGGSSSTTNPPKPDVHYKSKMELGANALNIHRDKPYARFLYGFGTPNYQIVNVDASGSSCTNVCDAYDWDWGDGSPHGSGVTASHTYVPGTYVITLKVTDTGLGTGTYSQQVTVTAADPPPVAGGTLTYIGNTWVATLVDSSTDAPGGGVSQVTVNWGDSTPLSRGAQNGTFPHTYSRTGTFTITQTVYDTKGQTSTKTYSVTAAYFNINGTISRSDATTRVPTATVQLKQGLTVVRTVYTNASGFYTINNLKPGTYSITVTKTGFNFGAAPQYPAVTVGPDGIGYNVNALSP